MDGASSPPLPHPPTLFAEVYERFKSKQVDQRTSADDDEEQEQEALEAILDEDNGLAASWADALRKVLASLDASPDSEEAPFLSAIWKQSRTWSLLGALYYSRLSARSEANAVQAQSGGNAEELLKERQGDVTPEELVQAIVTGDREIGEWIIIRDALLEPTPFVPSAKRPLKGRAYLQETAQAIRRTPGGSEMMARSLDIDCDTRRPSGLRGSGSLSPADESERRLLHVALFDLVRHGRLDEALELCRACREGWRAASLMGGRAWRPKRQIAAAMEDGEDGGDGSGNRNRALWKKTCKAIARNNDLSSHERALYGALAGELEAVLPVCESWDDHLWAHVSAKIERRIDRRLASLGGIWQSDFADGSYDLGEVAILDDDDLGSVFERVRKAVESKVGDGDEIANAHEPYHRVQEAVALGDLHTLLDRFAGRMDALNSMDPDYAMLIKCFFAHLVLFLRLVGKDADEAVANTILKAYIDALQAEENDELVAVYAAELRQGSAEDEYAQFLKNMPKTSTFDERRANLMRASHHGLNLRTIVLAVSQKSISPIAYRTIGVLESYDYPEPDHIVRESDAELIRGLEWLTMVQETFADAIVAGNAFLRYYFAENKIAAARQVLVSLPADLADVCLSQLPDDADDDDMDDIEGEPGLLRNEVLEFKLHAVLSNTLALVEDAERVWAEYDTGAMKSERMAWSSRHAGAVEAAYRGVLEFLVNSGWTSFLPAATSDDRRPAVFERLRQLHAPALVIRLHHLLIQSSEFLSSNLQRALDLPAVVADESHGIHPRFLRNQPDPNTGAIVSSAAVLEEYLELVRLAAMENLRRGAANPVVVDDGQS